MYAEAGLRSPFLQGFSQELHPLQEELLCLLQTHNNGPLFLEDNAGGELLQNATISDYDLGAEEDLFKTAEPIIEEPAAELDLVTTAVSLMPNDVDAITTEAIKAADIGSIQSEQPLSEVLNCQEGPTAKGVTEDISSEPSDVKIPALQTQEEKTKQKHEVVGDGSCLTSPDWLNRGSMRPNCLGLQGTGIGSAFGVRRAYSEGDSKTPGNGSERQVNPSTVCPPSERFLTVRGHKIEERRQKLSRYRKKKKERNFCRRIEYACRKALADSQPRIRGRFARAEGREASMLVYGNAKIPHRKENKVCPPSKLH